MLHLGPQIKVVFKITATTGCNCSKDYFYPFYLFYANEPLSMLIQPPDEHKCYIYLFYFFTFRITFNAKVLPVSCAMVIKNLAHNCNYLCNCFKAAI